MIEQLRGNKEMIDKDPYCRHEARMLEKINRALGDLGLTEAEERTWLWLAGNDVSTIDSILSVVDKLKTYAYGLGRAER